MPEGIVVENQKREMVERLAPELYRFEKVGEQVDGWLISADSVEITDKHTQEKKRVLQYLIEADALGRRVQILATYDLARKIRREDVGRYIVITYMGENQQVKKGDNFLKEFRVEVEKSRTASGQGPEITDADIPF